jgi:hypothetical protein
MRITSFRSQQKEAHLVGCGLFGEIGKHRVGGATAFASLSRSGALSTCFDRMARDTSGMHVTGKWIFQEVSSHRACDSFFAAFPFVVVVCCSSGLAVEAIALPIGWHQRPG